MTNTITNALVTIAGVSYPYLATHLHTDGHTVVYWLVLADLSGVVVAKGAIGTNTGVTPNAPYTPDTTVFPIGFQSPAVVQTYNPSQFSGTVTLSN